MGLMDDVEAITDKLAFHSADGMLGVETIIYHPRGKTPIEMNVPVTRHPPMPDMTTGRVERKLEVRVSTQDITSIDCPGDAIEIAFDRGGTAKKHTVKQIITQDAGGWNLLLG